MNKKLFSWKALAGLALLVAMGLTSCKNATEVDPTDPTGIKTPTQPSTTTKGAADVTITIIKSSDFKEQWNKWWNSLDAKAKKALVEKSTFNIAINNSGYELDGGVIELQNCFKGAEDGTKEKEKIVNVTFTTDFKNSSYNWTPTEYTKADINNKLAKKYLRIKTDNVAGNQVNIFFAAGKFDMEIDATKTQTTLNSEAGTSIGILTANVGTKKNALSLNSGIAVNGINMTAGDVALKGGSLDAKVLLDGAADWWIAKDGWDTPNGGYVVGDADVIYLKSVIVDYGATVSVNGTDWNAVANTFTIKKNGILNNNDWEPEINSIVGEHASARVNLAGNLDNGWARDMNNIGSIEKVVLNAGASVLLSDVSKYTKVEFANYVRLTAKTVSDLTFNTLVFPYDGDNITYSFSGVTFKVKPILSAEFYTETSRTSKLWQWIVSGTSGYWSQVTSASPLTPINEKAEVQEFHENFVFPVQNDPVLYGWTPGAATSTVLRIIYTDGDTIWPEGSVVNLTNCTDKAYYNTKVQAREANALFGNLSEKTAWYDVVLEGVTLKWRLTSGDAWILTQPTE